MTRFVDRDCLDQLRQTTDWKQACENLGLVFDSRRSKSDDWWGHSPFAEDNTPSFHVMPKKGVWYCFSTKQGGGIIELVQNLKGLNCFEAGQWLIDEGACPEPDFGKEKHLDYQTKKKNTEDPKSVNLPIRQSLLPSLSEQGTHSIFKERGISEKTCQYLGCGYLAKGKSSLADRIVFQVRGLEEKLHGKLSPVILSHIGRTIDNQQIQKSGKWMFYAGFQKRLELYNIDRLLTDPEALAQVHLTGQVIIVEGAFDVAKLVEAGIKNVVAILGSELSPEILPKLELIQKHAAPKSLLLWLDRDKAGQAGTKKTMDWLDEMGISNKKFCWEQHFGKGVKPVVIPTNIKDPCDMSARQLLWLRAAKII